MGTEGGAAEPKASGAKSAYRVYINPSGSLQKTCQESSIRIFTKVSKDEGSQQATEAA